MMNISILLSYLQLQMLILYDDMDSIIDQLEYDLVEARKSF